MDLALFGYAVPAIREEFGLSLTGVMQIVSAAFIIGGLLLVWLGLLTDRLGRKGMFQFSLIGSSFLVALHSIVPNGPALAALRGTSIAVGGLSYPVTGAVIAEEFPARYRGLFLGLMQIGYPRRARPRGSMSCAQSRYSCRPFPGSRCQKRNGNAPGASLADRRAGQRAEDRTLRQARATVGQNPRRCQRAVFRTQKLVSCPVNHLPCRRVSSQAAGGLTPWGQTPTFGRKPFALREALLRGALPIISSPISLEDGPGPIASSRLPQCRRSRSVAQRA